MRATVLILLTLVSTHARAATVAEIRAQNTPAVVFLQIEDERGASLGSGTGFIVSHDGYVVTAAHVGANQPSAKVWGVIGARDGTRLPLVLRGVDKDHDSAIWQLPQSATCRYATTLSDEAVPSDARMLGIGFPFPDGLTATSLNIVNLSSTEKGYYKADGFLRGGYSGGPILNEEGKVIAIVSSGTPTGGNNDLVPISFAIALLKARGVKVGLNTPVPFENSCYAFCRSAEHGVESWASESIEEQTRNISESGHNPASECAIYIAGRLQTEPPGTRITLLPGQGREHIDGLSENYTQDMFGKGTYHYHCKFYVRSGPTYARKQSPACGLWATQ